MKQYAVRQNSGTKIAFSPCKPQEIFYHIHARLQKIGVASCEMSDKTWKMKFEFERKVEGEAESSKVSVQVELFQVSEG